MHTNRNTFALSALTLASAALLTACGGGGGGGEPTPPAPTPAACATQTLVYDACSYNAPAMASGGSAALNTATTGYTGSATASCTNGTMSLAATAASCVKSGPTDADLALQTSVPSFTYDVDAPERVFLEFLNRQRAQCGFGLLAQNAALDKSATNHSSYVVNRWVEGPDSVTEYLAKAHFEIPGKSGFTGEAVSDRTSVAGYEGSPRNVSESQTVPSTGIVGTTTISAQGLAAGSVIGLLGTAYHMGNMMGSWRDAGVGIVRSPRYQWPISSIPGLATAINVDFGFVTHPQTSTQLRSFPCQGTADAEFKFGAENPDPLVGSGISYPVGAPILFSAPRDTTTFSLVSITIEPQGAPTGTEIFSTAANSVLVRNTGNDPHARIKPTQLYAIPHRPLQASTTYRVRASLLVNGAVQNLDYTFQTGIGRFATMELPKYVVPI